MMDGDPQILGKAERNPGDLLGIPGNHDSIIGVSFFFNRKNTVSRLNIVVISWYDLDLLKEAPQKIYALVMTNIAMV